MSRILIIEDDQSIAELERDYLEINGYAAEVETDGSKGLKKALAEPFDDLRPHTRDFSHECAGGFFICNKKTHMLN
ncbi:response regulator transcription factor [Bacillus thermotolerans]|uniref:DNA-binding response regulator n=1 Tax=Bacillus thermotolerans TaxID=1221996 RepID=A0A0F5I7P0_BACTR|nr:DNA-binding response regulator [Bacillus thermotolerans]KKB41521.1 DNA-binding response regulator [Bacillus thermotolerans]